MRKYQSSSQPASLLLLALLLTDPSFCYWSTTTLSAETPERSHASLASRWLLAKLLLSPTQTAKSPSIVNVTLDLEEKNIPTPSEGQIPQFLLDILLHIAILNLRNGFKVYFELNKKVSTLPPRSIP